MAAIGMSSVTETVQSGPMETVQMKLQTKPSSKFTPQPPNGTKPKSRLRLDPLRALEPARKKLTTLEAQRIMAVLVDSIKRTEIVTILPYIVDNLDRFSVSLGGDLVKMLQDHKVIIDSFEELKGAATRLLEKSKLEEQVVEDEEEEDEQRAATRSSAASNSNTQAQSAMKNLQYVAKQMQVSCKNILRSFSANPSAMNAVLKDQRERTESADTMILHMNELKEILMGKLLTTPVEENERNRYLSEISQREFQNAKVIEKLEGELNIALKDKDDEISVKNDVIRRLQGELHQIEKFSEEHIKRTKSEADKQQAADQKNSKDKVARLNTEMQTLESQLSNSIQEHRESESDLRKKKFKVETEVENWIQKYDADMGSRQDQFEEIDAVYTEEKKQLNELEERFKTLETEYNQIMEERRVARERREAAERELLMAIKAATTVQAFWRSFKVRKALKSKKKKGGKKKK